MSSASQIRPALGIFSYLGCYWTNIFDRISVLMVILVTEGSGNIIVTKAVSKGGTYVSAHYVSIKSSQKNLTYSCLITTNNTRLNLMK